MSIYLEGRVEVVCDDITTQRANNTPGRVVFCCFSESDREVYERLAHTELAKYS